MGFDINSASKKPVVREAASMHNDGGGGNLGYFEKGEHKEKKHSEESIFSKEKEDSFESKSNKADFEEEFSLSQFLSKIISSIKKWIKRIAS